MGAIRKKNGEWEKNRREKLNLTFSELSQSLPDHDPSLSLSKVQILRKALSYIIELRESNTQLLDTNCGSVLKREMAELRRQVSDLRRRNQQLVDLLRIAEITVTGPPPPLAKTLFSPPRKWQGRITQLPTDGEQKKEKQSNKKPTTKTKRVKIKNKAKTVKQQTIKTRSKTLADKTSSASNTVEEVDKNSPIKTVTPLKEINNSIVNSCNVTAMFPRTMTVPCTTVSLVLSNAKTSIVSVAQSGLLASPIMATGIQPGLSTLGPGTLIMPDGRVVTVPPVLAAAPQIIVNRPQTQPAVILMQNIAPVQHTALQMRPIVPKPKPDSTRTTYVNKVPISAIQAGRLNSVNVRSRPRKETNKKTGNGKNVEEKTQTNKKPERKAVLVELVKENQPETTKQKSQNIVKEKVITSKNISTFNKSLQNPGSNDNKTQCAMNSNSFKRKELKVDKSITSAKRKKVDGKVLSVSKVVAGAQDLQVTNKNNSKSKMSNETNLKTCAKHSTSIETRALMSDKEIPLNPKNQNVYNTEQTEIIQNIESNTDKHSAEMNTTRIVPINSFLEFNKDVNQSSLHSLQKPSDVRVVSNVYNQQTPRIVSENNNTSETLIDGNISKSLLMNNKVDKSNTLISGTVAENKTNSNIGNMLVNNCVEKNTVFNSQNSKMLVTQNCKATQITAEQLKYVEENKTDKTITSNKNNVEKKNSPEKTILPDVSQDLVSLFPIDPKLQVCPDNIFRDSDFRDRNLFMPISHSYMDEVRLSLPHSDFSNDLFSSLQVPTGGQHPESISPTAAFLMAFPLVSTSKTSEMITENEAGESQHATPTTILQIGNIDPLYQQTALMIENNVSDLHDPMKLNKATTNANCKNSDSKQMKRAEPFQQIQMNDLLHSEHITRNNCKEKKSFPSVQEHSMYLPCNKKKANGRTCEYPLPNEIINHFQDKSFEFTQTNASQNGVQNQSSHNRQIGVGNSLKKSQPRPDVMTDHQNPCSSSSQSYSFNAFPSGSEFSFPSSTYNSTNQSLYEMPKPPQTLSNLSTSIAATSNCVDFTSPYCSYPQKSYSNNKSVPQKLQHNNFSDPRFKEKSPSINSLPNFSTNFQFNSSNQPSLNTHVYPSSNQTDNGNYKIDSKTKKQKILNDSQRAPVNWMTTPDVRPVLPDSNVAPPLSDVRPVLPDSNIAPALPDVLFPPQKELDFNSSANNIIFSTSNNITPFNISSTVANNSQTFYPNSHFSSIDFQLDFAPFPEITSTKPSKTINTTSSNQFSWSPNKSSISFLPHIESHMIPSTLPTLVGDLALGTTTPSGPIDTFKNLNTSFTLDNPNNKKSDSKSEPQKVVNKLSEKDCFSNSERRNSNKNLPEFCQKTHSHQSTNTTSSFLSVSQLVDPVKSEQVTSRRSLKHTVVSASKTSTSVQKRNIVHQTEKLNHSKSSTNISTINHSNNYNLNLPNPMLSNQHQRKPETFHHNQTNSSYPNMYPGPWQNNKPSRASNFKGGSYSAESLIGEHQSHSSVPELTPFSVANQYNSSQKSFLDAPIVSSVTYSGADFSHQPLDFQSTQHTNQNSFNFTTHNAHYSEDYHNIGIDSLYQPLSKTVQVDGKNMNKRTGVKRREDMVGSQQMQYLPRDRGTKCTSPSHHATSSVTNFNLSTIFPEINDKRVVQGTNSYHSIGSKLNDNSTGRSSQRNEFIASNFNSQMQQAGQSAPPVSFANVGQPSTNFRPQ